ncbi:MAG: hypothetical protein HY537_02115, partial [Deltaproteobacteria bacterium]|nr:hypothetical protein [Deltaproteobacteria bacterium]
MRSVGKQVRWNLKRLFESDEAWDSSLAKVKQDTESVCKIDHASVAEIKHQCGEIKKELEALGTYCYLKLMNNKFDSQNILRQQRYAQMESYVRTLLTQYVLSVRGQNKTASLSNDQRLADKTVSGLNKSLSQDLFRSEALQPAAVEKSFGISSKLRQFEKAFSDVFYSLIQRDTRFENIRVNGKSVTANVWNLGGLLQNANRNLRKRAFGSFYKRIADRKYTLAELYINYCKAHSSLAAEGHGCFERELNALGIDYNTYERYRALSRSFIPEIARYHQLKFAYHKIRAPRFYDLTIALGKQKLTFSFREALELIAKAMESLGDEYCNVLR